jgi:choice-of-anchor C domain-containing protein
MKRAVLVASALMACVWSGAASAALIQNGSFEFGTNGPGAGAFVTIPGSGATINNWTVNGNVDWINGYWQASDGTHSVDLNGTTQGDVQQSISTVAGQHYLLTFDLSANPDHLDANPDTRKVTVSAGATSNVFSYTFSEPPNSRTSMNWLSYSMSFTGTGAPMLIDFSSAVGQNCCYGAALDNVNVTAVPEPATWGMMILGFLGVGIVGYRRRSKMAFRIA